MRTQVPTRRPLIVRAGQGLLCADYKIAVRRKLPSISCQAQRTSTLPPTGGQPEQARRCVRERDKVGDGVGQPVGRHFCCRCLRLLLALLPWIWKLLLLLANSYISKMFIKFSYFSAC